MIRQSLCGITILLLCIECSSPRSIYEKAIADFVQTDKRGTWTDLQFNVIEMGEPVNITIADSVQFITDKFETQKNNSLAVLNEQIKNHTVSRDKERFSTMKQFYQKRIDRNQLIVDSLTKTAVILPEAYKNGKPEEVLAKTVICKFSIVPLMYNTRQEITETFLLSAVGDKCYRRVSKPKQ